MNRTNAREIAVQLGFYASAACKPASEIIDDFFDEEYYPTLAADCEVFAEAPGKNELEYIKRLTGLMEEYRIQIDHYIEQYSHGWKLSRISKTALAVLRCAVCEILYMDDIPNAAAINEAVELAKGYDDADTVAFINGVLGGFMRGEIAEIKDE